MLAKVRETFGGQRHRPKKWKAFAAVIELAISVDLSRPLSQSEFIITEREGHLVGSAVFKTVVGK